MTARAAKLTLQPLTPKRWPDLELGPPKDFRKLGKSPVMRPVDDENVGVHGGTRPVMRLRLMR